MSLASKANLIKVLNQCMFNKSFRDFRKLNNFLEQASQDNYNLHKITDKKDSLHIHLWDNGDKLITISFYEDNHILLVMSCGCDYRMFNDSYNMQYDEIKSILVN